MSYHAQFLKCIEKKYSNSVVNSGDLARWPLVLSYYLLSVCESIFSSLQKCFICFIVIICVLVFIIVLVKSFDGIVISPVMAVLLPPDSIRKAYVGWGLSYKHLLYICCLIKYVGVLKA